MAINPLNATIPQPGAPFLTPEGGVSAPWLYYFISLLNRTGGQSGLSVATIQKQVASLFVEAAMADVAASPATSAFTAPDVMADDVPRTLNPFLAALMVADAT